MKKELKTALETAKKWLNYRPYFSHELAYKLKLYGYLQSEIEPVIQLLTEELVLNDDMHYQHYIEHMQMDLQWGPRKIVNKLVEKGCSPELAESKVKQYYQTEREEKIIQLAMDKVKKKFPEKEKLDRRISTYLYNRGFENPKRK